MTLNTHVSGEMLESLVMKRLQPPEVENVEDHLLICEKCREHFLEVENFVLDIKAAGARHNQIPGTGTNAWRRFFLLLTTRPAMAAAVVFATAAFFVIPASREPRASYQEHALTTLRGGESATDAPRASTLLRLKLDVRELPAQAPLRVTIVDQTGNSIANIDVPSIQAASAGVEVPSRLSRGSYWVRLSERGGRLLREYPLNVE